MMRFEFKLQDFWIGFFWKTKELNPDMRGDVLEQVDLWVCIVPCFPIHFTWTWFL